jgi:hypothetical protein
LFDFWSLVAYVRGVSCLLTSAGEKTVPLFEALRPFPRRFLGAFDGRILVLRVGPKEGEEEKILPFLPL